MLFTPKIKRALEKYLWTGVKTNRLVSSESLKYGARKNIFTKNKILLANKWTWCDGGGEFVSGVCGTGIRAASTMRHGWFFHTSLSF